MNTNVNRVTLWLKRTLIGFTAFIFGLAATGLIYQTAGSEADRRSYPPPGDLIEVGDFKMHLYCTGEGSPTVILEALSGGFSSYWGRVQPAIARTTRVCAYDRAGRGWSEVDREQQSLKRTARNLHTLLENAGINGPYVLVGHSIGGLYVRQFAADYPGEVAGIVLLDAAHPQQFERYPEMLKEKETMQQVTAVFPALARLGLFRVYFALGGEIDFAEHSERQKAEIRAAWSSSDYFKSQNAETMAVNAIYADAQQLGRLDPLPVMVISAGKGPAVGWEDLQADLARLSANHRHVTVTDATHVSLVFNPDNAAAVSSYIMEVLAAVQAGRTLAQ